MYIFCAEMKDMILVQPTNMIELGATSLIMYKNGDSSWDVLCDFGFSSHNYCIANIGCESALKAQ